MGETRYSDSIFRSFQLSLFVVHVNDKDTCEEHDYDSSYVDLRKNCAPSLYYRPGRFHSWPSSEKKEDGRPAFALASSGESRGNPAPIISCYV